MTPNALFLTTQKASFMFSYKGLYSHHIKAPVQWGVTTTAVIIWSTVLLIKAPLQWGLTTTISGPRYEIRNIKAPVQWGFFLGKMVQLSSLNS